MKRRDALQRVAYLLGGAVSAPTLVAILESCKSGGEQAATSATGASNWTLTDEQRTLLADIAEVIIPKTDTPGAKEAGVGPFIEKIMADCYPEMQQKAFADGLARVAADAQKMGGAFGKLKPEQQVAILKTLETEADAEKKAREELEKKQKEEAEKRKMSARDLRKGRVVDSETGLEKKDTKEPEKPTPFFQIMKELTAFGYFSSEVGAKQALEYDPIPGQYIGCMKLKPNQKAWAL